MELKEKIVKAFEEHFGGEGTLYASAGRINLIGEHTDYNGGFVFPGAIDKVIMADIRPNDSDIVNLYSLDLNEESHFGLNEEDAPSQQWARYVFGVCREIIKRGGTVKGFDAVFAGNVPLGAGLSSSAALESCFAFAMNDLFNGNTIEKFELAKIGQSTEHNYCGVNCGIMDQFASVFGKKDCLIRLDCRSLEFEYFPFRIDGHKLVLVDSVVKHELVDSPYNKRRQSCERVAKRLGIETLRDADMEALDAVKGDISAEDYMRAKFVIGEKQRVLDVCDALGRGDLATVGRCMYETHEGLSKDYEVSCEELDYLNDIAKECGVTGSRIMGGGFGGCTINLVADDKYDHFIATAKEKFAAKYGHEPKIYDANLSLPLFQGLSALRQLRQAQANIRTLDLQVEDAKDNVTLGIMAYYLQVLYSREMLAVRREELRLSQTQLQRQNDLLESGKVPEVDVLQAKAQVASGEVAVVNAENDYRLALVDLTRALELDDTRGFDILPVDFDSTISLPASADDVYRNALNTNNGILAARSGITQADHAVSIAKSGYLPTLSFNAGLGSNYYTLSGVENPSFARQMKDNFSKSIGFSLNIPIFDAFSTRNRVRQARAQRLSAELEVQRRESDLLKTIRQAYSQAEGVAWVWAICFGFQMLYGLFR